MSDKNGFSWWHDKKEKIKPLIHSQKNTPICVAIKDGNVHIKVNVNFKGKARGTQIYEESLKYLRKNNNNKMKFEDLVVRGFQKWSGTYEVDSKEVNVKVDVIRRKRNAVNIDLKLYGDRCGVKIKPFGWSVDSIPTKMVLYAHFNETLERSWEDVENVSAHEFGHLLGLGDAYEKNDGNLILIRLVGMLMPEYFDLIRKDAPKEVPADDIMRTGSRVTSYDIKLMIKAWEENKYQLFPQIE